MSDQNKLGALISYAESINLDIAQFETCLSSKKYADEVREDMALTKKLGITSVPSFVLARTDPRDPAKVRGISLIQGAQSFTLFKDAIDQALSE